MDSNKYVAQINIDLYYYAHMHHRQPEKIFMSNHLWSMLFAEDYCPVFYNMGDSPTYMGIPVQVFISGKLEYYFASSGFVFEEVEDD